MTTPDALVQQQLNQLEHMMHSGQFEAAYPQLKQLQKMHPKNTEAMLQLGFAERLLKHWPESIALLTKACNLAPANTIYLQHLAMVLALSNEGRNMVKAVGKFAEALTREPLNYTMGANVVTLALRNDMPQPLLTAVAPALEQQGLEDKVRLHYAAGCAIAAQLVGDVAACARFVAIALGVGHAAYDEQGKPIRGDYFFMLMYAEFLDALLTFRAAHPAMYAGSPNATLHVIGESHCLTPAHLVLTAGEKAYRVVPHIIMGSKAYAFTPDGTNTWKYTLEEIIRATAKDTDIVVGFGELDCRPDEGIVQQYRKQPGYAMEANIDDLTARYVTFVKLAQLRRAGRCFIAGVPAPKQREVSDLLPGEETVFTHMVAYFNTALAREAAKQQLPFIDLYTPTLGPNGWAKDGVHIDEVHLKPSVVAEAFTAALASGGPSASPQA